MIVLADTPSAADILGVDLDRRRGEDLAESERSLWTALAGETEVLVGGAPGPFWWRLVLVGEAPRSQFDALRELYGSGRPLPGPVVCLALAGRDFHGHRERAWAAPPGNLHLSVALAPGVPAAPLAPALTMLPAVAALDAIEGQSGGAVRAGVKWVNDVLVDGKKVAGVLTATASTGDVLDLVVLGIGMNLAVAPDVPPTPFVPEVGCLAEIEDRPALALPRMLGALLDALADRFVALLDDGPAAVHAAYREASLVIGRRVAIYRESGGDDPGPREVGLQADDGAGRLEEHRL